MGRLVGCALVHSPTENVPVGQAGQARDSVGALGGLDIAGDLLLNRGVDGVVDNVKIEVGGVGADGVPLDSEGVGDINILALGGGGDLEGYRQALVTMCFAG